MSVLSSKQKTATINVSRPIRHLQKGKFGKFRLRASGLGLSIFQAAKTCALRQYLLCRLSITGTACVRVFP